VVGCNQVIDAHYSITPLHQYSHGTVVDVARSTNQVDQEKHYTRIKREVECLKGLRHPNIIQLHDVFQTKRFICIVTEYATGGDLFDFIKTQVCLWVMQLLVLLVRGDGTLILAETRLVDR
jgi:serine/threonine protein kinase